MTISTHPAQRAFAARSIPRWLFVALGILAFAAVVFVAGAVGRERAISNLETEAEGSLPLAMGALRSEIDKQRTVPFILARDGLVRDILTRPAPEGISVVNEKLLALQQGTHASAIYVIDSNGMTIAASNYLEDQSFVGNDYRFRHYFAGAMSDGQANQYALGTVSGRPGLYLSERVGTEAEPLGVVVVKMELAEVEEGWRQSGRITYVTDERGIVLATSIPEWRFHTLAQIEPARAAAIRESLQFGDAPLEKLPVNPADVDGLVQAVSGSANGLFMSFSDAVSAGPPGWRLHILVPADRPIMSAVFIARLVSALALGLSFAAAAWLAQRRRREKMRREELTRTAAELETRVAERTAALSNANERLRGEISERESAEARVLRLRDDLAQANRLASLGQITAGVAHEINQPVAAIRTFTENAAKFLKRNETESVVANLNTVIGLTDRIGTITETLRGFSRRQSGAPVLIDIEEPIDGATLMLASRIKEARVELVRIKHPVPVKVRANRIRMEQVLVNLIRNAVDALSDTQAPRLVIETIADGEHVIVRVTDNGHGIPPDVLARLFTPFSTTKAEGLGLGLVISSDIVSDLGGHLSARNVPEGGAQFIIDLPEAK